MSCSLWVKAVSARGLRSADSNGFSDPYCVLKIAQQISKTKIRKKTLNPRWNEDFAFTGLLDDAKLEVKVMDWDRIGGDDFLGWVMITPNGLSKDLSEGKSVEKWFPLTKEPGKSHQDNVTGELRIILHLVKGTCNLKPRLIPSPQHQDCGILRVSPKCGKDLAPKDAFTGRSDPFCKMTIGEQEYRTPVIKKTLSPDWGDLEYFFEVDESRGHEKDRHFTLSVWDWNRVGKSDPMGQFVVPDVPSAFSQGSGEKEQWYKLTPMKNEKVSGEVYLKLSYTSALMISKSFLTAKKHFNDILSLLSKNSFSITASLLDVAQSNEISKAASILFHSGGQALMLLNHLFFRELKKTTQEETLFRGDSSATKVFVAFLKMVAKSWLIDTMKPLVAKVMNCPHSLECDPSRLGGDSTKAAENLVHLRAVSQTVFDGMTSDLSIKHMPLAVRLVLQNLRKLVASKFPNSSVKVVGAFIFLRFAVPSIVAPEGFGLIGEAPDPAKRRSLTLVSKAIQNVGNMVFFKEAHLRPLDNFVDANKGNCIRFYEELSTIPPDSQYPTEPLSREELEIELSVLVRYLSIHSSRIEGVISQDPVLMSKPDTLKSSQQCFAQMSQLIQ